MGLGFLQYFIYPVSVFAVSVSTDSNGATGNGTIPLTPPSGAISGICLTAIPQFIIQLLFVVGVIIAVAFLIYGGIKWVMSGGDKAGVEAARNHIVAAIVGLVIIAAAFVIIGIVFQLLGKTNPINNLSITSLSGGTLQTTGCQ